MALPLVSPERADPPLHRRVGPDGIGAEVLAPASPLLTNTESPVWESWLCLSHEGQGPTEARAYQLSYHPF